MEIIRTLKKNLRNIPGVQMKQKFVVFESDDWGSERACSPETLKRLNQAGYATEKCRMTQVDALESNEDLEVLFEALSRFKDHRGRAPVFSTFFNMANPDYDKIKQSGYRVYHYLNIEETASKYARHDRILKLYRAGIDNGILAPEYHGREHLHVNRWLRMLQTGQKDICYGYALEFNGFSHAYAPAIGKSLRAAYDLDRILDLRFMVHAAQDGLDLFEKTFGYRASYFVSPNGLYPRHGDFESMLKEKGIQFLGGASLQKVQDSFGHAQTKYFYTGKMNDLKQIYITRNALFEPHTGDQHWVNRCLKDVHAAFTWGKPAVISTHRANYIGYLDKTNRQVGIQQLTSLLKTILTKWPDVAFISASELARHVECKINRQ